MKTNVRKQKRILNEGMRRQQKQKQKSFLLRWTLRNDLEQPVLLNWQTWRRN